jgi:hypothetical protein
LGRGLHRGGIFTRTNESLTEVGRDECTRQGVLVNKYIIKFTLKDQSLYDDKQ